MGDFGLRLWRAPVKWRFIAWNWLDLVGSIPFVGPLRIARVARIARVLRLARSGRVIFSFVHRDKAVSTFRTVFILNIALVLLAAIAIYHVEHGESANFATIGDTIWWSLVAVTTLGFDGITPVTLEGKVFALLLVAGGVLLFGTFIGMVADYFIGDQEVLREMRSINTRLDRIEQALSRLPGHAVDNELQPSKPGSDPASSTRVDAKLPEVGQVDGPC
jgi:voltage-gated potassium channel